MDAFAGPKGRAAARCGEKASSAPRTRACPAELPHVEGAEQDKKAPTPVTAAAALCGDDHQPSSAPGLRAAARASEAAQKAMVVVEGQRFVIVFVREARPKDTAALCLTSAAMPHLARACFVKLQVLVSYLSTGR